MIDTRRRLRLIIASMATALALSAVVPIQPAAAEGGPVVQETMIAEGGPWSYLDTGTDPGPAWNLAGYDDATWQTGNGQFGYGDGDETTIVDYGPDPDNKYAATYFRRIVAVADVHQLTAAQVALTYDDAAAVYLNGTAVLTTPNLPIGFGHASWATANAEETMAFAVDPALFVEGDNIIAVEIHQAWRKSNDISFDLALVIDRNDQPKPPTVLDDQAETDQSVAVTGDLAFNDDPGLIYSTTAVIDPTVGSFTLDPTGIWTMAPTADYLGTIAVAHTGCDLNGACAAAELTIVVDVIGDVTNEAVIAAGSAWSFLDNGTDPGPSWNQPGHDDATWQTGNGQFGYGDGDETTTVSYGPDPANKYATTYFRKTITVDDPYQFTAVDATLTYDDAAVIHLNGEEIFNTGNLPAGFGPNSWATVNAEETIAISIYPAMFLDGENTIAVEIHQVWRKSVDISFDLSVSATRHVLPGPPAPTAIDDLAITPPNVAVGGNVGSNDRANDEGPLDWSVAAQDLPDPADQGTLVIDTDGSFQFTPAPGHAGTVTVPHLVCNAGACNGATLTIVVIDGNPAIPGLAAMADPGPQVVAAGLPVDIDLAISPVADGPDAVLTLQGLPAGLTVDDQGRISGIPTEPGTYPVGAYLIVDQDRSYATAAFDLVVDGSALVSRWLGLAEPVHLVQPADAILTVGASADLAIDFQATDGTFVYQGLPPGLTGTVDGHLTGIPTDVGVWTADISIVDLAANTAQTSMTITVTAGPPSGRPTEHPAIDPTTLDIRPQSGQHGVLGSNPGDSSVADVRVWDMQQLGGFMYVGGEFQQVQQGAGGAIVDQAFLARFDIDSGAFDPSFTPQLDGNVHALEVAPRGVLLVGGEFTNIDGVANTSGLAAIDPMTGQVDTGFRASVERPWSSNDPIVRELEVVGDLLYVVGNFSHLRDRQTQQRERFYKAARVGADYGDSDVTWRPEVTGGSVYGLAIDQDRGRVMMTGSFSAVGGAASTGRVAVVDSVVGGIIADTMPATAWTVFDIEYANGLIFLANGWNNQITVHDADDFALLRQYESDGDFQFIEKIGDYVYAGCHCTQDPEHPTARVLDARTGLQLDMAFNIGGHIDGAWSVATDDRGCAWIGGDIWDGGFNIGTVWARGFARFCADA